MPKFEGAPTPPPEETGKPEEVLNSPPETVADAVSELEKDPEKRKETKSKIKRLALTLGLSAFVAGTTLFLARDKEVAEAEEAEIHSVEYEANREKAREILLEKLGMDLVETAEKHGFTVHFKVDNGDGDYVVHIGQTHRVRFSDIAEILGREDIVQSQTAIYNLLQETSEKTDKRLVVFSEGFDRDHETGLEKVRYLYQAIDNHLIDKNTPEILEKVNKFTDQIENSGFAEFFDALARQKFRQFQEEFKDYEYDENDHQDQLLKIRVEHLEALYKLPSLEVITFGKLTSEESEEIAIVNGAGLLLSLKGIIEITPADSSELLEEAIKIHRELEDVKSAEERKKLEESWTNIVHSKRDKVVIESVSNYQDERENVITRNGVYIVVYGNNHDFSEAVKQHNEQNPDNKLGLIKFAGPVERRK